MLQALGFKLMGYHMNEGHSAFLTLALLRRFAYPSEDLRPGESAYDLPQVRECEQTVTSVHARIPLPVTLHHLG